MTNKIFLSSILFLSGFLMSATFSANINTQNFQDNYIPQTTVDRAISQCKNTINFAFYDKQKIKFTSDLSANNINDIWRIINTKQGSNGQNYQTGAADSTKIFIYNPYGLLSTTDSISNPNSFLSDFLFVSNIKPSGVNKVYVGYQSSFTYILGGENTLRKELVGQIVYNHWVRQPSKIKNNGQTTYTYTIPTTNGFEQKIAKLDLEFSSKYPRLSQGNACANIFVAKCGDGVIDDPDKLGGNNTDGKQGIQITNGFVNRRNTNFTGEVCDDGEDNGKPGKCNLTCNGYVKEGIGGYCGDGIINDGQDLEGHGPIYYDEDGEEVYEVCDLGPWNEETGQGNHDGVEYSACSSFCEPNTEPEALPEELG